MKKLLIFMIISFLLISCKNDRAKKEEKQNNSGLFMIRVGGKKGFMDKEGKFVINPQFDDAGDFKEGLARVAVGKGTWGYYEKWGYIDKEGKYVIEF